MIAAGIFTGYPIATAFAVSGSVVGVGLAAGGQPATAEYVEIVAFWLLTPVVAVPIAYATARPLRADSMPERWTVPVLACLVAAVVVTMGFTPLDSWYPSSCDEAVDYPRACLHLDRGG